MLDNDDDLARFAESGPPALPTATVAGRISNAGASIWFASYGRGPAVVLLHGGMGHSGNWGYQVPDLVANGYQVVVIDSRGHGRSTRDAQPYSYDLLGSDVLAVLDDLDIGRARFVGWSDGACTALVLAARFPLRVASVFFFGCNMDNSGTYEHIEFGTTLQRCIARHQLDYTNLSATPDGFEEFAQAVGLMQRSQPNYSAEALAAIAVPVLIVQSEFDEFIRPEHALYLAQTLPHATYILLPGVSHFAPLQRPSQFTRTILDFLANQP